MARTIPTSTSFPRAPRGSALVFVVALLGLLAVLGTLYIASAHAQRNSAHALSQAVNLDLAQDSVNTLVRQAISAPLYDAAGMLGGPHSSGGFGTHAARPWTMPERGILFGPGQSNQNPLFPDNLWLSQNLYRDPNAFDPRYNDFSLLTPFPFNPFTGTYDPTRPYYDPTTGQPALPTFKAVADNATLDDAFVQLLPSSDADGIRYRFGIRILDTSRMANLSVGVASDSTLSRDPYGTYSYTFALGHPQAFHPDDQVRSLDSIRKKFPAFDLSDELELRSYGSFGTPLTPRFASADIWPHTLGNFDPPESTRLAGNGRRGLYTTVSTSRKLRPYFLSDDLGRTPEAYTLTLPGDYSLRTWPPFPAVLAANQDLTSHNDYTDARSLAFAATNIATAMEKIAGYSPQEACAFAANYMSSRWNSWFQHNLPPLGGSDVPAYWLLDGFSFIDEQGICLPQSAVIGDDLQLTSRPPPYAMGSPTDLHAPPGLLFIGYSAQPFLNEVAVRQRAADRVTSADDFAVELYNPYNVALSLRGYRLCLSPTVSLPLDNCHVPARGYLVLTRTGRDLAQKVHPNAIQAYNPLLDLSHTHTLYLMREYLQRNCPVNQVSYAAIDQIDCTDLVDLPIDANRTAGDHYLRRPNDDPPAKFNDPDYLPRWCAAVHDPAVAQIVHEDPDHPTPDTTEVMTLGAANPPPATPRQARAIRLYDRFADRAAPQRGLLYNVNEFNRIMRIAHQIDPSTGLPAGAGTLSTQLCKILESPDPRVAHTQFPAEASVYFDFRTPPWAYSAGAGPDDSRAPSPLPFPSGDPRAMRLLDCLAFINLPPNTNRVPGQINVNTAPAEVLSMIPILNNNPGWVGGILAYRWRTTSNDPRIPPDYRTPWFDFTDSTGPNAPYPGYGIRSLGELEIPLSLPFTHALTLDQRDALWADVFNLCTVRSDSFVLYGCLEAVQQNPAYRGPFDNFLDWYQTQPTRITDDPANTTAPLLRLARRRWIALIDTTSNASRVRLDDLGLDPNFALPRIIAAKDLPR